MFCFSVEFFFFHRQSFILVWMVFRQTSDFAFAPPPHLISSVVVWYEAKKGLQGKLHLCLPCNLSGPFSKWGQLTHESQLHFSPTHICIYVVWRKETCSFCCVERDSKAHFASMLWLHFKNVIHTQLMHFLLFSCNRNIWLSDACLAMLLKVLCPWVLFILIHLLLSMMNCQMSWLMIMLTLIFIIYVIEAMSQRLQAEHEKWCFCDEDFNPGIDSFIVRLFI